ncbi:MAG: GAF domain-containing sensor histidine kinase [Acidimicrobiia bacterium]
MAALFGDSLVPVAVLRLDRQRSVVVSANGAFRSMVELDDVVGLDLGSIGTPSEAALGAETFERIRFDQLDLVGQRHRYRRRDGTTITVHVFDVVLHRGSDAALVLAFFVDPGRMDNLIRRFQRDSEIATALAQVRAALLRGESTEAVLELICQWTRSLASADYAAILQVVDDGSRVTILAGDRPGGDPDIGWPIADDDFGRALRSGAGARYTVPGPVLEAASAAAALPSGYDGRLHVAVAPITASGERFGALAVTRLVAAFLDEDMAVLAMFADGVSDALSVARERTDLERLRMLEVRRQIARNLHDEVIQDLIGVRLALSGLVADPRAAGVDERLRELPDELNHATRRLRDVVAGLDQDTTEGLGVALQSLVSNRAQRQEMGWTVEVDGPLELLVPEQEADILRVLNEAISNVVRHADGTQVDVRLTVGDDDVRLVVEDDGVGPHGVATGRGMGLGNMRARAAAHGGRCEICERPGGGTRLVWSIPRSA